METPPPPPPANTRPSLTPPTQKSPFSDTKTTTTQHKKKPPPLPQNRSLCAPIEFCTKSSSSSSSSFWNLARYLRDRRSLQDILRDYPSPPSDLVETLSMLNIASMCYDIKDRKNPRSYFLQHLQHLNDVSASELSCCLLVLASALRSELISIMKGSGSPHQSLLRSSILRFVRVVFSTI